MMTTTHTGLDDQMREDLERVRRRQRERDASAPGGAAARPAGADFRADFRAAGPDSGDSGGGLKEAVDRLLIADFFFVIFALAWFAAGLAQQAGGQSTVRFF